MGCAWCQPCPECGHAMKWEFSGQGIGCMFPVGRWSDLGSGPGREVTVPCGCRHYHRKVDTMTSPPTPGDSTAAAADTLRTAGEVMREIHAAYRAFHREIAEAHHDWQETVKGAHRRLGDKLAGIAGAAGIEPPFGGDGGPS